MDSRIQLQFVEVYCFCVGRLRCNLSSSIVFLTNMNKKSVFSKFSNQSFITMPDNGRWMLFFIHVLSYQARADRVSNKIELFQWSDLVLVVVIVYRLLNISPTLEDSAFCFRTFNSCVSEIYTFSQTFGCIPQTSYETPRTKLAASRTTKLFCNFRIILPRLLG